MEIKVEIKTDWKNPYTDCSSEMMNAIRKVILDNKYMNLIEEGGNEIEIVEVFSDEDAEVILSKLGKKRNWTNRKISELKSETLKQ